MEKNSHIGEGPGQPGLVSVVIPTYNRAYIIDKAINSALSQQYRPVEIIVIDDGSTDDTALVVGQYGPEVRYFRKENAGVSAARNHGLREARGEFVALLDSDDIWLNWKILAQVAVLRAFPEVGMVWTDMIAVDEHDTVRSERYLRQFYSGYRNIRIEELCPQAATIGELWPAVPVDVFKTPVYIGDIFTSMLLGGLVHTSTVLLRRERLRLVGGFDTSFKSGEDYEFHLHTSFHGPVALLDAPSIQYRIGAADQLTEPKWQVEIARNNLVIFNRWLEKGKDRHKLSTTQIRDHIAGAYAWLGNAELDAEQQWNAIKHLYMSLWLKPDIGVARRFGLSLLPAPILCAARNVRNRLRHEFI